MLGCVLLVVLTFVNSIQYGVTDEYTDICRLFKNDTLMRKPGTCNEYIQCHGDSGIVFTCDNMKIFDSSLQKCVDQPKSRNMRASCDSNPCEGVKSDKWIADSMNCQSFYYCNGGVANQGYCPLGHHFNENAQMCEFASTSNCLGIANPCKYLKDKTRYRDEKDCSVYYECSNGKPNRQTCKNTYFDVNSGKCIEKSLVECTKHPLPPNVCGTSKKPKPGYKSDGATCRGYFQCADLGIVQDLEPLWDQCPQGTFFGGNKVKCVDPLDSQCTYNRCQGRPDMLVQSSSNDCHNYIICENGRQIAEKQCKGDMFFDEKLQACVPYEVDYYCCDNRK